MAKRIRVGDVVLHPYCIGLDNQPLKGLVLSLPYGYSTTPYYGVRWDGDKFSEVCERNDFIYSKA